MRRTTRGFAAVAAVMIAVTALGACERTPDIYVAIGDSYTSGPGVTNQTGEPASCMRSDRNYPAVAANRLLADASSGISELWDVSCSGATTRDFYEAQGDNIPQLAVVGSAARVVTIGIGGNDIGFSSIVTSCVAWQDCKGRYVKDGVDELRGRIDDLAPTIGQVIRDVQAQAKSASVFVVGYPAIVPADPGTFGCQTMTPSSIRYLDGVEQYLNAMLESEAEANDAIFVDTYTSSRDHDACSSDPWVNGLIAIPPVHPNAKGLAHTGDLVADAIEAELAG